MRTISTRQEFKQLKKRVDYIFKMYKKYGIKPSLNHETAKALIVISKDHPEIIYNVTVRNFLDMVVWEKPMYSKNSPALVYYKNVVKPTLEYLFPTLEQEREEVEINKNEVMEKEIERLREKEKNRQQQEKQEVEQQQEKQEEQPDLVNNFKVLGDPAQQEHLDQEEQEQPEEKQPEEKQETFTKIPVQKRRKGGRR
jgi:hypothetical protein